MNKKILKQIEEIDSDINKIETSIFISSKPCVKKITIRNLFDLFKLKEELYLELIDKNKGDDKDD